MTIWIVFALMTGAVALAVLWPLARVRAGHAADASEADLAFYRSQIADIDREAARGLIGAGEAEGARAEAARRLLRARDRTSPAADASEAALRRRRAASAFAISMIPLVSLGLYGAFGSPHIPAQPLAARLAVDPAQLSLADAVGRIEAHLARNPDDGRGWELLAPVYLRMGRAQEAAGAYERSLALLGATPERLTDHAEALVLANDGVVSAEARKAIDAALAASPDLAKARYYRAVALEQDGDRAGARSMLAALAASAVPDTPWLPMVKARLAALDGTTATAAAGDPAIRAMVEGLAARLEGGGGDADSWARLVRSYAVLGEKDKADAALASARRDLAGNEAALARLGALATELALTDRR